MSQGRLVRLRAIEPEDATRCHRWINDPRVTDYMGMGLPASLARQRDWALDQPDGTRTLRLAIETLEGQHIGNCGLHRMGRADRGADLSILIGEEALWSKGYGTDATLTLCGIGFGELNLHRIGLRVWAFNKRAIRCYERCGFAHEGRLRQAMYRHGEWQDVVLMGILAHEFRERFPDRWLGGVRSQGE